MAEIKIKKIDVNGSSFDIEVKGENVIMADDTTAEEKFDTKADLDEYTGVTKQSHAPVQVIYQIGEADPSEVATKPGVYYNWNTMQLETYQNKSGVLTKVASEDPSENVIYLDKISSKIYYYFDSSWMETVAYAVVNNNTKRLPASYMTTTLLDDMINLDETGVVPDADGVYYNGETKKIETYKTKEGTLQKVDSSDPSEAVAYVNKFGGQYQWDGSQFNDVEYKVVFRSYPGNPRPTIPGIYYNISTKKIEGWCRKGSACRRNYLKDPSPNQIYYNDNIQAFVLWDAEEEIFTPINYVEEIEYSALVTLVESGQLVSGKKYRITNYECTTSQTDTQAAKNFFDIIVTATSADTLSEEAGACLHEGDTYFANSNLGAWKLKYSLYNDTERFAWAENTGTGVIYEMIDEYGNKCPYDFKNITFKRSQNTDRGWYQINGSGDSVWTYTFGMIDFYDNKSHDVSVEQRKYYDEDFEFLTTQNNIIEPYYVNGCLTLNNIAFVTDTNITSVEIGSQPYGEFDGYCDNVIYSNCYDITFGANALNNEIQSRCNDVTFGSRPENNKIGSYCNNIIMRDDASQNVIGNDCYLIVFDDFASCNVVKSKCINIAIPKHTQYVTFETGVQYVIVNSEFDGSDDQKIQNLQFCSSLTGTAEEFITVTIDTPNKEYTTWFGLDSNGEFVSKNLMDPSGAEPLVKIAYNELKKLRDESKLIPGQQYRITDYHCVTTLDLTQSADNQFDIIVVADDVNKLNENARACIHEGDTYFIKNNLAAWELKYTIDANTKSWTSAPPSIVIDNSSIPNVFPNGNYTRDASQDTEMGSYRYAWVNPDASEPLYTDSLNPDDITIARDISPREGGDFDVVGYVPGALPAEFSGCIYYMKDEFNNECEYDFKNILMTIVMYDEEMTCYTFLTFDGDASLYGKVLNNKINSESIPFVIVTTADSSIGNVFINCNHITVEGNHNIFKDSSDCTMLANYSQIYNCYDVMIQESVDRSKLISCENIEAAVLSDSNLNNVSSCTFEIAYDMNMSYSSYITFPPVCSTWVLEGGNTELTFAGVTEDDQYLNVRIGYNVSCKELTIPVNADYTTRFVTQADNIITV